MSFIDTTVLNIAYIRHDNRELWDSEPIFVCARRYARVLPVAKGTRIKGLPPSQLWWPASQMFGDETLGDCSVMPPSQCDDGIDPTGTAGFPYRIRGFALDSVGAGVGDAAMQLFRTADDSYQYEARSVGPSGQYDLGTDDTVTQHYIVAYRTGPDIEGTTVNTLTGAAD